MDAGCGLRLAVLEDFEFWLSVTIATGIQYHSFKAEPVSFPPPTPLFFPVFPFLSFFLSFILFLPFHLPFFLPSFLSLFLSLVLSRSPCRPPTLASHPLSFSPLSGLRGGKERQGVGQRWREGKAKRGETGESLWVKVIQSEGGKGEKLHRKRGEQEWKWERVSCLVSQLELASQ